MITLFNKRNPAQVIKLGLLFPQGHGGGRTSEPGALVFVSQIDTCMVGWGSKEQG